jgi:hypothetical protein
VRGMRSLASVPDLYSGTCTFAGKFRDCNHCHTLFQHRPSSTHQSQRHRASFTVPNYPVYKTAKLYLPHTNGYTTPLKDAVLRCLRGGSVFAWVASSLLHRVDSVQQQQGTMVSGQNGNASCHPREASTKVQIRSIVAAHKRAMRLEQCRCYARRWMQVLPCGAGRICTLLVGHWAIASPSEGETLFHTQL